MALRDERSGTTVGFAIIAGGVAVVLAIVLGIVFLVRSGVDTKEASGDACRAAAESELGGTVAVSYVGKPGEARWEWRVGNGEQSRTCLATLDDGQWSTSLLSDVG